MPVMSFGDTPDSSSVKFDQREVRIPIGASVEDKPPGNPDTHDSIVKITEGAINSETGL